MPPVEVPEAAVRSLLARWFPGQAVVIERMGAGVSTPVYRVTVGDEVSYLRLGEEPGERRDAEVRVHELVRDLGIAVPEILRWEREPPELDRSAALTARVPGVALGEFTGDATETLRQAGRNLARLNAIPVVGYGWVDFVVGDDRHLVAEHPTRSAWAREYLAAAETVLAAGVIPPGHHQALARAVRQWADLTARNPACLAHGDFDASHIYVDPVTGGTYRGLIDFGEIRGADPLYDLGQVLVNAGDERGRTVFDGVVTGYGEVAPVDLDAVRLQAIAIATWALAIQLGRKPSAYRNFLAGRLGELLDRGHWPPS
ncbi:MAG: aminoglycoside phosphotransferase family protein [Chloroflexota bacterium]|nr:aminoglycoside phosphotransferase family protein [Chloroflexota bacterium]